MSALTLGRLCTGRLCTGRRRNLEGACLHSSCMGGADGRTDGDGGGREGRGDGDDRALQIRHFVSLFDRPLLLRIVPETIHEACQRQKIAVFELRGGAGAVGGAEGWGNPPLALALTILRIAAARYVTSVGLSFADPLAEARRLST